MASNYSFDIVSDFDHQELVNALDQTVREIKSRYDLKDTQTTVELGAEAIDISTDRKRCRESPLRRSHFYWRCPQPAFITRFPYRRAVV